MKKPNTAVAEAKAAEAQRKAELGARLDREAVAASERIRARFEADRQAMARRYGATRLTDLPEPAKN